jgi:hypothetical protein
VSAGREFAAAAAELDQRGERDISSRVLTVTRLMVSLPCGST